MVYKIGYGETVHLKPAYNQVMSQRTLAIILTFLGVAVPSIYLGTTIVADQGYSDESALGALFPWFFILLPPSLISLAVGLYKFIKGEVDNNE